MVLIYDPKYKGIASPQWVNVSFFPDFSALDVHQPLQITAGASMMAMPKAQPSPMPTLRLLEGGGGGLGPRMLPPQARFWVTAAALVVAAGVAAKSIYDHYHPHKETVGEPSLDDLRRMLEEAERTQRELEKQSPAWYSDPFSPDVTRHQSQQHELALWIERLKLEIDLKEWEDVRNADKDDSSWSVFVDARIEEVRQKIATHATQSQREEAALSGIMASASEPSSANSAAETNKTTQDEKEVDWETLAAAGDNLAFARAEDQFIQQMRATVVAHIDTGESAAQILEWYNRSVKPEVMRVAKLATQLVKTSDEHKVFHDIRNRLLHLEHALPMLLNAGRLEAARASCQPPDHNLSSVLKSLQSRFSTTVSITQVGFGGLRLTPNVDLDAFMAIMENLVGNAADHPRRGQRLTSVRLEIQSGALFVHDKGAGMTDEALENLRSGVRIHDGKVIESSDRDNDHGFGFQIARQNADKLNIELDIDSELGVGTTVSLVFPDGMIEPDPMEYVLIGHAELDEAAVFLQSVTPERRLELVREMNMLAKRIIGEHMTQVMDVLLEPQTVRRFQRQVRAIGERFSALLTLLIEGLPADHVSVRSAHWNAEVLLHLFQPQ
ncbi:MAG: hypothetical protein COV45_06590 [Deltaproteobacteria bacterium CG11_big_fil_rev_8_21_14_0_20_47_16]|nr:MAG: hypothetical protein COV45_06590 [Deltaproteobacteria bacterium CG11_big_fil_rev_8_21_14_0_20_47_16]